MSNIWKNKKIHQSIELYEAQYTSFYREDAI